MVVTHWSWRGRRQQTPLLLLLQAAALLLSSAAVLPVLLADVASAAEAPLAKQTPAPHSAFRTLSS